MVQKHPSQYFDNIELFLSTHLEKAPLSMLKSAAISNGCPEGMVDDIINSANAQELNRKVTSKGNNMYIEKDGIILPVLYDYHPTYNELINRMKSRFVDMGDDRIKAIVDTLIRKGALSIFDDGRLYRTKVLLPRIIINI